MCGCDRAEGGQVPTSGGGGTLSRRDFLAGTGAVAGAATLAPVDFAQAGEGSSDGATRTRTITGRFDVGVPDFVYLPVRIPRGVRQIDVSYDYDRPAVPPGTRGNALDIGIFDERGHEVGDRAGFRGWSGGFRGSFSISAGGATPGYLPGPVNAGTWFVVLGPYTVAPSGLAWTVELTLTFGQPGPRFVPAYPPARAGGRGRAWYRGDAHLHTVHSDGRRLPEEVAAGARDAGLDFIVSTDHNTSASHGVWGPLAGDDLLIIPGEEITTRNGHLVAAGLPNGRWIDWRYRARDGLFDRFLRDIRRGGGIAVAAHPFTPCLACNWKFGYAGLDAVEVWNGPWTPDDELAVAMWDGMLVQSAHGRAAWLPATGNSDAHSEPQVIGLPHNVVLADDLTRDGVLAGLRAGRSWIAETAGIDLTFTAGTTESSAGIGERLPARPGDPVTATLVASGVPNGIVNFVTDEGSAFTTVLPPSGSGTVTWPTTAAVSAYVRAEIRHPTATPGLLPPPMAAMTNPVFLGRDR